MELIRSYVLAEDAREAALFFWTTLLAAWAAYQWSIVLSSRESILARICHVLVVFWSGLVVCTVIVSLTGVLTANVLLSFVLSISVIAILVRTFWPFQVHRQRAIQKAETMWLCAWGLLFFLYLGHAVTNGLMSFPDDWDSLNYHIPLIDHWLQAASLYAPNSEHWSDPGNNQILGLWLTGPFSGDYFVPLTNLIPTTLLACASVELAKEIGLRRPWAHLCGFASVVNFATLKQMVDVENDVAVAACFTSGLLYAFRYYRHQRGPDLLLGAVTLGLLIGIKYYAIGYAGLLFAVWVALSCRKQGWVSALRVVMAMLLGMFVVSGFWYARNLIVSGSPLYPREFFKYPDLLSRIYPDVGTSSFLGNRDPDLMRLYADAIWHKMGFCQLTGFLLAPLSICWYLGSGCFFLVGQKNVRAANTRLALGAVLAGTGVLLLVTPFSVENIPGTLNQLRWGYCPVRYGLCFLNSGTLAFVFLINDIFVCLQRKIPLISAPPTNAMESNRNPPWVARVLVVVVEIGLGLAICSQMFIAAGQFSVSWLITIIVAGNIGFLTANVFLIAKVFPAAASCIRRLSVVAGMVFCMWLSLSLSEHWHKHFAENYESSVGPNPEAIKLPRGSIICSLNSRYYPLFGSYRQYKVYRPIFVHSPDGFLCYLAERETDYIWFPLGEERRGLQGFRKCYESHPEAFEKVREDHYSILCAFRKERIRR